MTGTKLSEVREDAASTSEALYQECVAALDRLARVVCPCPGCGGKPHTDSEGLTDVECVLCHGTGIDPEATVEGVVKKAIEMVRVGEIHGTFCRSGECGHCPKCLLHRAQDAERERDEAVADFDDLEREFARAIAAAIRARGDGGDDGEA